MVDAWQVTIPLLNPNEPELQLAGLDIAEGDPVKAGQRLCTLESTKSASELYAEQEGYIAGLAARQGDLLRAGAVLCWIASGPDWKPPTQQAGETQAGPDGLRITAPARALAESHGVDLSALPAGPLITEEYLRRVLGSRPELDQEVPPATREAGEVLLYGGGGHAKALIELIRQTEGYTIRGVIDDGLPPQTHILDVPVLGPGAMLAELRRSGVRLAVNAVGGIGDIMSRVRVFRRLIDAGFDFPTLVHPTAFVEESAVLQAGVQVFPHAYIGSEARVGFGAIVNTAAVVSHDCMLERYVNLAPAAVLAGGVQLGRAALVGMSVTINLAVVVGEAARIGNSAVIKADVPAGQVVRAGAVWP